MVNDLYINRKRLKAFSRAYKTKAPVELSLIRRVPDMLGKGVNISLNAISHMIKATCMGYDVVAVHE
ncbi:hypothetical protein HQ50_10660 [Porphyromonas sp. COT-052 OH4946]|nr:hypothetical protein HQ50_10660 [Porphyromonas sp. COT-052 OH4946]